MRRPAPAEHAAGASAPGKTAVAPRREEEKAAFVGRRNGKPDPGHDNGPAPYGAGFFRSWGCGGAEEGGALAIRRRGAIRRGSVADPPPGLSLRCFFKYCFKYERPFSGSGGAGCRRRPCRSVTGRKPAGCGRTPCGVRRLRRSGAQSARSMRRTVPSFAPVSGVMSEVMRPSGIRSRDQE